MKASYLIGIAIFLCACKNEYQPCQTSTNDDLLNLYSDITNELVVRHFYNFYLGKDEEEIFKAWTKDKPDTTKIRRKTILLHNKLFNDSTKYCTLLMDTTIRKCFNPWHYKMKVDNSFQNLLKKKMSKYATSGNGQAMVDSLNTLQTHYQAKDFHLCTAKMISLKDAPKTLPCAIGIIQLSKVFLNAQQTQGMLYCAFKCGGLCGKGLLLEVAKEKNAWKIKDVTLMWIW